MWGICALITFTFSNNHSGLMHNKIIITKSGDAKQQIKVSKWLKSNEKNVDQKGMAFFILKICKKNSVNFP